ncbi:hypothetical protein CFBP6624_05580 [Agrobacterium tumefaciens]|uniref:Uncharacterized protein n=1 Tax=Agrobacterium tumefaciens TaxID=358 RepID=A0AAE6BK61_AGRTU|nr:hypothetical protein CFBP6624_05580 [Agrobacterium tumefaciens]
MFVVHWTYIPHCGARLKKQKFKPFQRLDFYFSNTPVFEENKPAPLFWPCQGALKPMRIP